MDEDDVLIVDDTNQLRRITPWLRHIQDLSSRVWVLHNDVLTVVPRKEQTVPVTVTLLPCQYLETLEMNRGEPMYLGLKSPECCLFCTQEGEQPVLRLKDACIIKEQEKKIVGIFGSSLFQNNFLLYFTKEGDVLELYSEKEPIKPFLFYHNKSGTTSTFESAAFPGWFIAVCSKGSCPLFLTQELGKTHITDFEMIVVD